MDVLYKIIGVKAIGERICLTVKHVEGGKDFKTSKVLGNLGGFMENMKLDAISSRNPDQISITMDEYQKGGYNLGEVISVSINGGKN